MTTLDWETVDELKYSRIKTYDDYDDHDKHDVDFVNMMLIKYKHDDMIKSAWNLFELRLDRFACDC